MLDSLRIYTNCSTIFLYLECKPKDVLLECAGVIVDDFNSVQKSNKEAFDKEKFQKMVAERAYCKSEKRGFIAGHEMEDWLEAELEIKNQYFYWFQYVE